MQPIKFEIFQFDMEKIMYQLNRAIDGNVDREQLIRIRNDFQRKIDIHKENGEWV